MSPESICDWFSSVHRMDNLDIEDCLGMLWAYFSNIVRHILMLADEIPHLKKEVIFSYWVTVCLMSLLCVTLFRLTCICVTVSGVYVSLPLMSVHCVLSLHNWLILETNWRKQPRKYVVTEAQGELQCSRNRTYNEDDNMYFQSVGKNKKYIVYCLQWVIQKAREGKGFLYSLCMFVFLQIPL